MKLHQPPPLEAQTPLKSYLVSAFLFLELVGCIFEHSSPYSVNISRSSANSQNRNQKSTTHIMGDSRRNRRPDSRQMWDESDRRDRRGGHNRDNDRDRRGYRSRSRERRGYRDRSRSPDRRHRDRDGDRNRPRDRGPRHHDDRDRRDRRREDAEGAPPRLRGDERRDDDRDKRSMRPHPHFNVMKT